MMRSVAPFDRDGLAGAVSPAPLPGATLDDPMTITLDRAQLGAAYVVHEVVYPGAATDWPQRLEEIGFLPGERVMVLRRGVPGGDPLAVRIGHSTFALRRSEAACVQVRPWPGGEGHR
jgi:ferrous iron transport protein A